MSTPELVSFLQQEAGDLLRGVVRYTGDSEDVLTLREDIQEYRLQSEIDRMLTRLRPESHGAEERAFPFGDLYVTVRRFEDAIVLHFPTGSEHGVVIALEPEAGRDLNQFTSRCLAYIRDE